MAVSEATWFTAERPAEIEEFWKDGYPGIDGIPNKMVQLESAGYEPVACFRIPENCWTEHFFEPQEEAYARFLDKHRGNKAAEAFIANMRYEKKLYDRYKEHYGYTFFIGRKA